MKIKIFNLIYIFSLFSPLANGQIELDSINYSVSNEIESSINLTDTFFRKNVFFSFGVGFSNLHQKSLSSINFENNISYIFSQYFSSEISVFYGKDYDGKYSFIQGNLNVFVHPVKIKKIRIIGGGGLSFVHYTEFISGFWYDHLSGPNTERYKLYNNSSFGENFIFESLFLIKDKFSIGLKLFLQQYQSGFRNSGVFIIGGVKLY